MGNSIREQILRTVLTRLAPVAASEGATLHRSPTVAISRNESPALVLFPESESITERANDRVTRDLTVRLTALARAIPPETPEGEADRLLTAAHAALMADVNLGNLALGIREIDCEWEVEDADATVAAMPARYVITYRTLAADLTSLG